VAQASSAAVGSSNREPSSEVMHQASSSAVGSNNREPSSEVMHQASSSAVGSNNQEPSSEEMHQAVTTVDPGEDQVVPDDNQGSSGAAVGQQVSAVDNQDEASDMITITGSTLSLLALTI